MTRSVGTDIRESAVRCAGRSPLPQEHSQDACKHGYQVAGVEGKHGAPVEAAEDEEICAKTQHCRRSSIN